MATGMDWTVFADNPYSVMVGSGITTRPWYDPQLRGVYSKQAVLTRIATWKANLLAPRTNQVIFTFRNPAEAQLGRHDPGDLMVDPTGDTAYQLVVTTEPHHVKKQYRKHDDRITYWRRNGKVGLIAIVGEDIAPLLLDQQEKMARAALFDWIEQNYHVSFAGGKTDIGSLTASDTFSTTVVSEWSDYFLNRAALNRNERPMSHFAVITPQPTLRAIMSDSAFVDKLYYSERGFQMWLAQEVGAWGNARFIQTPTLILPNGGAVSNTANIVASVKAGQGGKPYANVHSVGTSGEGITCDQLDSMGDGSGTPYFSAGDVVTITTGKTSDGRPDFTATRVFVRQVSYVDLANKKIWFTEPLTSDLSTDLGSGVYGYIFKGLHIHLTIGLDPTTPRDELPLAFGFSQLPQMVFPPDPSDTQDVYRFVVTYEGKIQPFHMDNLLLHVSAAPVNLTGNGARDVG